jgi:hypothetical protein
MRGLFITTGVAVVLGAMPAFAGRAVDDAERAKLTAAVTAAGCSAGKMEFDDGQYEVDDARCSDGKTYDLKFDAAYKLTKKTIED